MGDKEDAAREELSSKELQRQAKEQIDRWIVERAEQQAREDQQRDQRGE